MKKLSRILEAIPGWLFLTIIVGIAVIFLDPIMEILESRVTTVKSNKLRSDAKTVCFRDDFPIGRQTQACRDGLFYAKKDNDKKLQSSFLARMCELDDANSCFIIARENQPKLDAVEYQVLLEKACRNGAGGVMEACGELAPLIKDRAPEFAKKYLEYACAAGHNKYCN